MPQPIFQPIIGGGFDQLAGQHQFWGQFNAAQDAQNIARREQANREYNDWLGNVSQLQRAEGAQQDLWAREDISQALTRKAQERRETEATRQFEEGLKYSREAMRAQEKLQRDQFKQQLDLTRAEDQKENELLASFGETFAPQVARAVENLKQLDPEHAKAQNEVQTLGRSFAQKLNNTGVYYDGKTFSLRWAQGASVDPEVNTLMLAYNKVLGEKVAKFTGLDQSYKLAVKQLEDLQKTAADGGFVLRDDGTIYNYKLKRAFGKPFAPQASKPPPPPAAVAAPKFTPTVAPPTASTGTAVSPPTFQPTFGRALTPEMFSAGTGTDTNIPRWAGNAAGAAAGLLFPPVMPYVAKGMLNQATGEQPVFTPTATGTTNAAAPAMIGPDGAPLGEPSEPTGRIAFGNPSGQQMPSDGSGSTVSFRPPVTMPQPSPAGQLTVGDMPVGSQPSADMGFVPQQGVIRRNSFALPWNVPIPAARGAAYMAQEPGSQPWGQLTPSGLLDAVRGPELPPGRVWVISPDGKRGHIPRTQVPTALKAGYKLA